MPVEIHITGWSALIVLVAVTLLVLWSVFILVSSAVPFVKKRRT